MLDKKLTDEEIISSLEVISTTCNCNECKIRSGKWGTCNCSETTANAALDLINRQRTEISEWKEKYVKNFEKWELLDRRTRKFYAELYEEAKEVVKSEAIKEFAERLKNEINIRTTYSREQDKNVMRMIDNLVKELISDE